ncbi:MAG: methylmalonyl Co-A mutase-associated GTPase MeaB, partial [Flavobacterium sp.]
DGIDDVWEVISDYVKTAKSSGYFDEKRHEQNQYWMLETINERLKSDFYSNAEIISELEQTKKAVQRNELTPFAAAQLLLDKYFRKQSD